MRTAPPESSRFLHNPAEVPQLESPLPVDG